MNLRARIALAVALVAGFFCVSTPLVSYAGFGISPPSITENRLVAGSVLKRTIYLVQGNAPADVNISLVTDSKNIKEWLSFSPGEAFTIPAGVQQFPLKVTVSVPKNAAMGVYKAYVRLTAAPPMADSSGEVAIALGGRIDITLTVGNEVFESYEITGIEIRDITTNQRPTVLFSVNNTGNVPSGPHSASFELFNKFGNIRLGYGESDITDTVPPFSEGGMTVTFPIDVRLAEGSYYGRALIYADDQRVVKETRTTFRVKKGGFSGLLAAAGGIGVPLASGVIGGLAILVFIVLLVRRKRRRAAKRK